MNWIGLDVGGANLKIAYADDSARSIEFPLWKNKDHLQPQLEELLTDCSNPFRLAVTMTGELADCFASKRDGVQHIVDSVVAVSRGEAPVFYQTNGKFVGAEAAILDWQATAAANWHAMATFAARFMPGNSGILLDIGSTTTDIIPVKNGQPCSQSLTDTQRLQTGQLVYTGVSRSPVNGLLNQVTIDGWPTRVANEMFATTLDAHVYLKNISQSPQASSTADGRPATIECAAQRLARVVCADAAEIGPHNVYAIAEAVVAAQTSLVSRALEQVRKSNVGLDHCVVLSGSGRWLALKYLGDSLRDSKLVDFAAEVSRSASECGPAFAAAQLVREAM